MKLFPALPPRLILIALSPLLLGGYLPAQSAKPFDTLEIGLHCAVNTNRNRFHDYWKPRQGVAASLATPFYYGQVRAGIQMYPFYGRDAGISNFTSAFIYLGWGLEWTLPHKFDWFNGFSIGNNLMIFADAERESKYESELSASINSSLSYTIHDRWAICLAGHYQIIFTYKRIKLLFLSMGLSHSVSTPKWLREFLE